MKTDPNHIPLGKFLDKVIQNIRLGKIMHQIPKDAIMVDIGCGHDAKLLHDLKDHIKEGIGVDQKAEIPTQGNITIKKTTLDNKIPLADNYADVVTMLALIEHVEYPHELLQEAYRILKPGGKILITTPTPRARVLLEVMAFKLKIIDIYEILDHKNYFWGYQLYNMLRKANFTDIHWDEFELGMNTHIHGTK